MGARMALRLAAGYIMSTAAVALLASGSSPAFAQEKVLRATLHADVRNLDPFWTTQTITGIHAIAVYDTLFGVDDNLEPQPQMVGDYEVSEDGKEYTFTLRDGLMFHDGEPVTTEDVIESLKRWGEKDQAGKALMGYVTEMRKADDKTFTMFLSEPYGMVLDSLGKAGTMVPVILRAEDAIRSANEQIDTAIGSGPFKMVKEEWVPGSKTVYVKNEDYKPREGEAQGMAGGKAPKVDRIELLWIPDPQTAMQALIAGEIDYLEQPAVDFLPILESSPGVKVATTGRIDSHWGTMRLNHLHPPFDNPKVRQAMYHLVNQEDFMASVVGNPEFYKECHSYITCGTPYSVEDETGIIGDYDPSKVLPMMEEAGYDGSPITVLAATDHPTITPGTQVLLNAMRLAGLNIDAQALDWGSVVGRRAKRETPAEGGWNVFMTTSSGTSAANPVINTWLGSGCDQANVGWPCDQELEALRTEFAFARTNEDRMELARKIQARATEVVPYIVWGQWTQPYAYREDRIAGIVPITGIVALWNIERVD
jgi:peptide/nickel transport system substrate-binding protein